jgi:molybdopterin-guanine dinucleotide biosynthesis protein MobB
MIRDPQLPLGEHKGRSNIHSDENCDEYDADEDDSSRFQWAHSFKYNVKQLKSPGHPKEINGFGLEGCSVAPEVVAIVGRSGVGKTYLVESVLTLLCDEGVKVATVKHTHHQVFSDKSDTDTDRHRRAGAHLSALAGPGFCTFFVDGEAPFEQVVSTAGWDADLVLVEGYKSHSVRKIEVVRDEGPMLPPDEAWMTVTSAQGSQVATAILAMLKR